jgi:hypothetical protein
MESLQESLKAELVLVRNLLFMTLIPRNGAVPCGWRPRDRRLGKAFDSDGMRVGALW